VELQITPQPSEEERQAILAALAEVGEAREPASPWAAALLPRRGDDPAAP
jgi:hypothetical protein